jgi:hypothetical protein
VALVAIVYGQRKPDVFYISNTPGIARTFARTIQAHDNNP